MKKVTFLVILLCIFSSAAFAQIGINNDGTSANPSAGLDVKYADKGLLIPRVALVQSSSATPVASPAVSLLVYNTETVNDVSPGYYFWNGLAWVRLSVFNGGSGTTNYVTKWTAAGSLGNSLLFDDGTNVGIGTTTPSARLDIDYSPLGVTQGNAIMWQKFQCNTTNNDYLNIYYRRFAGGNDWTTAEMRIQRQLDGNNLHYISFKGGQFNGSNGLLVFGWENNELMAIGQNGNVGIGTTSPFEKLSISTGVNSDVKTSIVAGGEGQKSILYLATPWQGLSTNPFKTAIIAEGITYYGKAKLHFCLNNTDSNDKTYDASVSDAKMTILADGKVGIGTTSPDYRLDIECDSLGYNQGDNANWQRFVGTSHFNEDVLKIYHHRFATGPDWLTSEIRIQKELDGIDMQFISFKGGLTPSTGLLVFGYGFNELMAIENDGDVGIGTSYPAAKLDVKGITRIRDDNSNGYLSIENAGGSVLRSFSSPGTASAINLFGTTNIHDDNSDGYLNIVNAGGTWMHSYSSEGATSAMTINNWLGVGTSTPGTAFQVIDSAPLNDDDFDGSGTHIAYFCNTMNGYNHGDGIYINLPTSGGTYGEWNDFITFTSGNNLRGAIEGFIWDVDWQLSLCDALEIGFSTPAEYIANGYCTNGGVSYTSDGADYAEYLEKEDHSVNFNFGMVVGVKNGKISLNTADAEQIMVVSGAPIVLGNIPPEDADRMNFEKIAFLGQVPVIVIGPVHSGDYLVPTGRENGTAIAVSPDSLQIKDIKKIIGRSWETNMENGGKFVLAVVGIKTHEVAEIVEKKFAEYDKRTAEMEQLKASNDDLNKQLECMRAQIDRINAYLEISSQK